MTKGGFTYIELHLIDTDFQPERHYIVRLLNVFLKVALVITKEICHHYDSISDILFKFSR